MGLHVWRSERADGLLAPLRDLLVEPPEDPFAQEVIAVPTAGIERWLSQELSLRLGAGEPRHPETGPTDGVCANVDFPFPGKIINRALEAAGRLPDDSDVWRPDRLVWPLLAMAGEGLDAEWWGPAASHLASTNDGRRFSAARILVDLFDRYAVHRPEMILAWSAGEDVGPDLGPIAASHAWQAELWRQLRARVDTPSTAERLAEATDRIAGGAVELDLPERLSVFGLTALPASYLRVLKAVSDQRDVHLFLLHPSPALWDRVEETLAGEAERGPRADDPTDGLTQNPILSSWGRDAREMQVVFAALGAPSATHQPARDDPSGPNTGEPKKLLHHLQADIRADRAPAGAPLSLADPDDRPVLDPLDRSVQVHACHGRIRQVQVLRDAILHLLAEDDELEARDIVVMCPDVETFAPLIEAVFGAAAGSAGTADHHESTTNDGGHRADGTPELRVRLADRSIRQTNPVLKVVGEILELADGRLTGPEVLDLVGREPVRRRFRFDDDDLERLETWVPDLGIRWGLDAADRERYGLPPIADNTWRAGIDRLLVGVAMADEELRVLEDTVPYDDVEGTDVDLAGRFAECVQRLDTVARSLRDPRGIEQWRDTIATAADLLTSTSESDPWMRQQLHRILDEFVDHAAAGGDTDTASPTELTLAEVRVLLSDRLRGRPTRANHRTGDLTVCTLVPMRAVPHKVVCLLGMDDGSFPRRTATDGDDLVDLYPFVGDRDPRTEDRQLLLDALLSARDALVVTYSGRDERTNEPLPPAVPLGELLDTIDATVRLPDGATHAAAPRDLVVTEHPLQAFDARNYLRGKLHPDSGTPWSFDTVARDGAEARRAGVTEPPAFISSALPPRPEDETIIEIDALVKFLEHPAKAFLGQRLGVWFSSVGDGPQDGLPLDLTGLPTWGVGTRLLEARLAGHTHDEWERAERARGTLPPEPLSAPIVEEVTPVVEALLAKTEDEIGSLDGRAIEIDHTLPDGRRLVGVVNGVCDETIANVSFSKLSSKVRAAGYARLVALTAAEPDTPWRVKLIGRKKVKALVEVCTLGPLADDAEGRRQAAEAALAVLVDLYDRGMSQPAPLYPGTSEDIARKIAQGKTAWHASYSWETTIRQYGGKDDIDPCHVAVLGRVATFSEILDVSPEPDDVGPDWEECEQLIVAWARRLWDPIIALEKASS